MKFYHINPAAASLPCPCSGCRHEQDGLCLREDAVVIERWYDPASEVDCSGYQPGADKLPLPTWARVPVQEVARA